MRREGKPLLIFGDGHQSRDYVHVSDVVRANLMAADHPHALHGEAVNIGSWRSLSVLEIARVISPDERSICFMPKREGEVRHSLADCGKAASLFGWKAKTDVMDWIRNAT
jgi:UDP-glucose 4-epimerase